MLACARAALYTGNHIGFLGGICELTGVPGILRWDCIATDWFHAEAYPTYLYHNPHAETKTFALNLPRTCDLYDTITHRFIALGAKSGDPMELQPDQAVVLVCVPSGATLTTGDRGRIADGVIIDRFPNGSPAQ